VSYNITLSSSMRSNLLSLRNIATQMSKTQNILSTGKKVNNAIDNATSYYQARSLTHRAADLNSLLDSMSQGIQTIKAAVTGLDQYGRFLEQAAIVAENAYENAVIPTKEWLLSQMGENGAVVSTAQELKDAVAANKETICVYGKIDLGELDKTLTLKDNQKLVGVGYFGDFDNDVNKYSSICASSENKISLLTIKSKNNLISDLSINFNGNATMGVIRVMGTSTILKNVALNIVSNEKASFAGIETYNGTLNLDGNVSISTTGKNCFGIWNYRPTGSNKSVTNILKTANVNIITTGEYGLGIVNECGTTNIAGKLTIKTQASRAYGLYNYTSVNNNINIENTSEVLIVSSNANNIYNGNSSTNSIKIAEAAKIALGKTSDDTKYYKVKDDFEKNGVSYSILPSNIKELLSVEEISSWNNAIDGSDIIDTSIYKLAQDMNEYLKPLDKLDDMVEDCSYQGVNLLKGDDLTLAFNESRDHNFVIKGVDMHTMSAGITTRSWETKEDISNSIREIKEAVNKVRQVTEKLGNNLSIIQTRQSFNDALVDVLEVGADKLVLADMNEVSAEYLTLQTRQQLAVNSLTLASQSASSVLGLF